MKIDLAKAKEAEFREMVCKYLWDEIDPRVLPLIKRGSAAEVHIGAFKLDLLAANQSGGLTIVEFKVNASKMTLAQLFLYPRAL